MTTTIRDLVLGHEAAYTVSGLKEIANRLGMTTEQLIGFYIQRAPLEWIDVYIAWAVSGFGLLLIVIPFVVFIRYGEAGRYMNDVSIFCLIAGGILFLLGAVFSAPALSEAIKATCAPQAYAIDAIIADI